MLMPIISGILFVSMIELIGILIYIVSNDD